MAQDKCFAMSDTGGCTILHRLNCNHKSCTFHKTEEEKEESERKAKKRCTEIGIPYGETSGKE